jgi:hypothetical protein
MRTAFPGITWPFFALIVAIVCSGTDGRMMGTDPVYYIYGSKHHDIEDGDDKAIDCERYILCTREIYVDPCFVGYNPHSILLLIVSWCDRGLAVGSVHFSALSETTAASVQDFSPGLSPPFVLL